MFGQTADKKSTQLYFWSVVLMLECSLLEKICVNKSVWEVDFSDGIREFEPKLCRN